MLEMWYYTCEGKQMDPVSIRDLKRLAGDGVLKPTDMVWKEGLPRWVRASSLKDLFPDASSVLDQYFSNPKPAADTRAESAIPVVTPAPTEPEGPRADDEEELRPRRRRRRLAEEDDEPRDRPRRRRPAANAGGYGTQILIGSLVGVFIIIGCFVLGIVIVSRPKPIVAPPPDRAVAVNPMAEELNPVPPVQPPPGKAAKVEPALPDDVKLGSGVWPISVNLPPGAEHIVKFRVKANHPATITVTPQSVPGKIVNLDMQVFKDSDNALIVADATPRSSASVVFTLPATEIVRVRVHNASKKATVTQFTLVYNVGN